MLPRIGTLVISIDLEWDRAASAAEERDLERATLWLVETLSRYKIAATWAVTDPAASAATERVASAGQPHELAVLGDWSWVGHAAGRARFLRELARRVSAARATGMPISTLALRGAALDDHIDLLVKHGLSAVRKASESSPSLRDGSECGRERGNRRGATGCDDAPRLLRYGLWELPVHCRLPAQEGWLAAATSAWRTRRLIDRGIAAGAMTHLLIDGPALAASLERSGRRLDRVLRHAALRRQQGRLAIQTVRAAAEMLAGHKSAAPARSILRPAA